MLYNKADFSHTQKENIDVIFSDIFGCGRGPHLVAFVAYFLLRPQLLVLLDYLGFQG